MESNAAGAESRPRPVLLRLVRPDEVGRWDELMAAHHYVGFGT
ncbi:MAG: hypothetical protein ACYDD0_11195 [Candidatus Dormibacteria bacterium]